MIRLYRAVKKKYPLSLLLTESAISLSVVAWVTYHIVMAIYGQPFSSSALVVGFILVMLGWMYSTLVAFNEYLNSKLDAMREQVRKEQIKLCR